MIVQLGQPHAAAQLLAAGALHSHLRAPPCSLQTGTKVRSVGELQDIDELCVVEVSGCPRDTAAATEAAAAAPPAAASERCFCH